jgi:formaldehyde-activating enzyme involved in methanogenesis
MLRADRKMHPCCLCYLKLTIVVKPLNVIRVALLSCGQAKLLDHFNIHQVVVATIVNDGMYMTVLDDEEYVEEVAVLSVVLVVADRSTQISLHDQGLIGLGR